MSIATEIQRIETNIASAYAMASSKGATLPEVMNSNNLATTIGSIATGSSFKIYYEDYVVNSAVDSITIEHNLNSDNIIIAAIWSVDDGAITGLGYNDTRAKIFIPQPNVKVSASVTFDGYNPSIYNNRTTGYISGVMTTSASYVDSVNNNSATFVRYGGSSKFIPGNYKVLVVAK